MTYSTSNAMKLHVLHELMHKKGELFVSANYQHLLMHKNSLLFNEPSLQARKVTSKLL